MMMRAGILAAAMLLATCLGVGCEQQAEPENDKPVVALVMKSLANEFFKTMEEGAQEHQAEHAEAYGLRVVGMKNETDVAEQISNVELLIAQGVDAIVIAPADSKALAPVLERAQEAGIAVVNIDNKLDAEVLEERGISVPFVGPDNRKGARMAGDYLAERLEPGDPVAIIEGAPNAFNGIQRKLGFEDAMQEAGMEIVSSQTGYWETDQAQPVAAAMLTEHPGLKALLCANDSMALGAAAALRSVGKQDQVYVIGFDNIGAARRLIEEGRMLCTVAQHPDMLAVYGIAYALEILAGETAPEDKETPVDLVTRESV